MQTLIVECKNDAMAEHIYTLLSHLPKKEVVVTRSEEAKLTKHKKLIEKSLADLGEGRVIKTGKTVYL